MFYKVIKNNRIIDVLDKITYLRYQPKHNIMVLCGINQAQAILSSDNETIWHERTLHPIPVSGYDTVELVEICESEYRQLKALNGHTPQEIFDDTILYLIENGIL